MRGENQGSHPRELLLDRELEIVQQQRERFLAGLAFNRFDEQHHGLIIGVDVGL